MKQQLAAAVVALSMAGGVGTGVAAHALSSDGPSDKPTTSPTTAKTTTPAPKKTKKTTSLPPRKTTTTPAKPVLQPVSTFQIFAGSIGPIKAGMTKAQALATGYLEPGTPGACGTPILQWKSDYSWALDLTTLDDGQIESVGVSKPGPRTRSGLQVGSTYASVKAVLGESAVPEATEQNQTALYVSQGASWIGFRFGAAPDAITDTVPVNYIEVRNGSKPVLTPPC
jgi:hypothetical protein